MRRINQLLVTGCWLLVVFALLATSNKQLATAFADTVYFKAGDSAKGLVVEEHRDRIVLSTEGGERTLLRREIDEIFYAEPERNQLYLGDQALEQGEVALARGFYQKALQIDPELGEAEDALRRLEDAERKMEEPPVQDPLDNLWRRWGLALENGSGSAVVSHVREHSLAEEAGLERSDTLIGCWGESLAFLPAKEVAETLLGPAGTLVKVTVQRTVSVPAALSSLPAGPVAGQPDWPQWKLEMERLGLTNQQADPAGAAGLAGLRPGDRIVRLNGQPTRYLPLAQARKMVQESKEKGLVLVIHRDLMVRRE